MDPLTASYDIGQLIFYLFLLYVGYRLIRLLIRRSKGLEIVPAAKNP